MIDIDESAEELPTATSVIARDAWRKADRAERYAKIALILTGLVTLFYVLIPVLGLTGVLKAVK